MKKKYYDFSLNKPILLCFISNNFKTSGVPFKVRLGQAVGVGRDLPLLPPPPPQPQDPRRGRRDVTIALPGRFPGSSHRGQLAGDEVRAGDDDGGREEVRGGAEELSEGELVGGDGRAGRSHLAGHAAAEVFFSAFFV